MGKRRVLVVNNNREYLKAKCVLLRNLVWNESKKEKILLEILEMNVNGIVEDISGIAHMQKKKYGLNRQHYSRCIGELIAEGYFVKQGYCFVVHPLLSSKGDDELLVKIKSGMAKDK